MIHRDSPAARTIAAMPALIVAGRLGQAWITARNSGSSGTLCAPRAPDSASLWARTPEFPAFSGIVRIPSPPLTNVATIGCDPGEFALPALAPMAQTPLPMSISPTHQRSARPASPSRGRSPCSQFDQTFARQRQMSRNGMPERSAHGKATRRLSKIRNSSTVAAMVAAMLQSDAGMFQS